MDIATGFIRSSIVMANLLSRVTAVEDDAWVQLVAIDVIKRYFWFLQQ